MKIKLIIVFVGSTCLNVAPSEALPSGGEKDIVEQFEFRLSEIKKMVEIEIEYKQLDLAPKWNGVEFDALPISMEKAVLAAKKFLADNGCSERKYLLDECSILKIYRIENRKEWIWKVTFADTTEILASVYPTITIPVLLDGSVPKAIFHPLK